MRWGKNTEASWAFGLAKPSMLMYPATDWRQAAVMLWSAVVSTATTDAVVHGNRMLTYDTEAQAVLVRPKLR